jgi:hypothetical protein
MTSSLNPRCFDEGRGRKHGPLERHFQWRKSPLYLTFTKHHLRYPGALPRTSRRKVAGSTLHYR